MSSPPRVALIRGKHLVPNICNWSYKFLHLLKTLNNSISP